MDSDAVYPELALLRNISERLDYHPEGNTFVHLKMVMERAFEAGLSEEEKIAALLHDVGKAITGGQSPWPDGSCYCLTGKSHKEHDDLGVDIIKKVFSRESLPNRALPLALGVSIFHQRVHALENPSKKGFLKLLKDIAEFAIKMKESPLSLTEKISKVCECDARGRLGFEASAYPQGEILRIGGTRLFSRNWASSAYEDSRMREYEKARAAKIRELAAKEDGTSEMEKFKKAAELLSEMKKNGLFPNRPLSFEDEVWNEIRAFFKKAEVQVRRTGVKI